MISSSDPRFKVGMLASDQLSEDMIRDLRDRGLPVILISHNMPNVFEVADRIHIQRLGRRVAVITPSTDLPTMMLLWIPMCVLYELGIGLCLLQPKSLSEEMDQAELDKMVGV